MNDIVAKTSTISSLKIAVALAFLSGANLLAAASMVRPSLPSSRSRDPLPPPVVVNFKEPDLVVNDLFLNVSGDYDGASDLELSVVYQNIGKATVGQPFQIAVTTEPAGVFHDAGLSIGMADKSSETAGEDNKFNLAPGETAMLKIVLNRDVETVFDGSSLRIFGYVDFVENKSDGNIPEFDETNNEKNLVVPVVKSALAENIPVPPAETEQADTAETQNQTETTDTAKFCDTGATSPDACGERLKGFPELSKKAIEDILFKYACVGVYKGIPLFSVRNQIVPLEIDAGALLSYPLGKCSLAELGVVTTLDAAKKCLDELNAPLKDDPMYLGVAC